MSKLMNKYGKRGLTLLLALVMSFSLIIPSTFADTDNSVDDEDVTVVADDVEGKNTAVDDGNNEYTVDVETSDTEGNDRNNEYTIDVETSNTEENEDISEDATDETEFENAIVPLTAVDENLQPLKDDDLTAFAVFDSTDKSLSFYVGYPVPEAGDTYEGHSVTEVYTGFDSTEYSYNRDVPWYSNRTNITSIVIDKSFEKCQLKTMAYWFYNFTRLTDINGLANLDTSSVTTLYNTFYGCSSLTNVDSLAGWDTSKVTTLQYTFRDCSSLTNVDGLAKWDTSKVTTLYGTFYGCSSLTNVDSLANWDISAVTTLHYTFYNCSSLENVDGLANWKTSFVTDMQGTFYGCSSLTNVDSLANWDISAVTTLYNTFYGCSGLENVDRLANWKTSFVTDMQGTFNGCSSLTNVDSLAGWDTSKVTTLRYTFRDCSSLTNVDGLAKWDTSKVTTLYYTFYGCSSLTNVDGLVGWDTSKVTTLYGTFYNCSNLTYTDVSKWDTSQVTQMIYMFAYCSNLKTIYSNDDVFVTTNVTGGGSMFIGCSSLVGGNGTEYDSARHTYSMAHIDTTDNPGYFTDVNDENFIFELVKSDSETFETLYNAVFTLSNNNNESMYFILDEETKTYSLCDSTDDGATTEISAGDVYISGLKTGVYTLTEIVAPDGYKTIEPMTIYVRSNGSTSSDITTLGFSGGTSSYFGQNSNASIRPLDTNDIVTVNLTKIWQFNGSQGATSYIVIDVYQNGVYYESITVPSSYATNYTTWKYTFELPKYDDYGNEYVYTFDESYPVSEDPSSQIDGWYTDITTKYNDDGTIDLTIENQYMLWGGGWYPVYVNVTKIWDDTGYTYYRPDDLYVNVLLRSTGVTSKSVTLNADNNWESTLEFYVDSDAPPYMNGINVTENQNWSDSNLYDMDVTYYVDGQKDYIGTLWGYETIEIYVTNTFVEDRCSCITVPNTQILPTGEFRLNKTNDLGNTISGASFTMTNDSGDTMSFTYDSSTSTYTMCDSGTTGADTTITAGNVLIDGLTPGTYTLTETSAPDGYEKSSNTYTITVDDEGNVTTSTNTATVNSATPYLTATQTPTSLLSASVSVNTLRNALDSVKTLFAEQSDSASKQNAIVALAATDEDYGVQTIDGENETTYSVEIIQDSSGYYMFPTITLIGTVDGNQVYYSSQNDYPLGNHSDVTIYFNNVPIYSENGDLIEYKILVETTEDDDANFEHSVTYESEYKAIVNISYIYRSGTPTDTYNSQLSIYKNWRGDTNHTDLRQDIVIHMIVPGYAETTYELSSPYYNYRDSWASDYFLGALYDAIQSNTLVIWETSYSSSGTDINQLYDVTYDFNISQSAGIYLVSITVTNTYHEETVTVPNRQLTSITVNKEWEDNNDSDGIRPNNISVTLTGSDGTTKATTLSEANSWSYTFDNLYVYDTNGNKITYTVSEDSVDRYTSTVGNLTGSDESGWTCNITNTRNAVTPTSVQFAGTKSISGVTSTTKEFTFNLYETSSDYSINGLTATDTKSISSVDVNGTSYSFDSITYNSVGTYYYVICEQALSSADGWSIDLAKYDIEVNVVNNDSDQLVATVTVKGIEVSGIDNVYSGFDFNNTYNASATIQFVGTKVLDGAALTDNQFNFTVTEDTETVATGTNDASGNITFSDISYTLDDVGEHTYIVQETQGNAGGIDYDSNSITVIVNISDNNNGTLNTAVTVNGDTITPDTNGRYNVGTFNNTYSATGSLVFSGEKKIEGIDSTTETFSFNLYETDSTFATDGITPDTTTVAGSGAFTFDQITYNSEETYYYVVSEANTESKNWSTDDTVYYITVVVSDNGDGTLSTNVSCVNNEGTEVTLTQNDGTVSGLDFTNTYVPTGFGLSKVDEDGDKLNATFTISDENGALTFTSTDDSTGEYDTIYTLSDDGTGSTDITAGYVYIDGLSDGTYTLTEKTAPAGYVPVHDVTITITDGVITVQSNDDDDASCEDGLITVVDKQQNLEALPNAGSTGTLLWIVVGMVVLAGATSAALGYRKRIRQ